MTRSDAREALRELVAAIDRFPKAVNQCIVCYHVTHRPDCALAEARAFLTAQEPPA